jgi:biopolymer transport protein ExbD/biopolymer transport protein TolR
MAMDMTSGKRGRKGPRPEMNVTPLVDVVLVLLIIFMVITPLLSKQFWINLPVEERDQTQREPQAAGDGPVVVSVDAEGVVRINREIVPIDGLATKLRRVLAARGDRAIFFDAAETATYESAVQVLDVARGGGASTIAILTRPLTGS